MSWGIDDWNFVAFIKPLTEKNGKTAPLYLYQSRNMQVIASAATQNSSGIILIGEDATKQREFAINFNRSLENWERYYEERHYAGQ